VPELNNIAMVIQLGKPFMLFGFTEGDLFLVGRWVLLKDDAF